MKKIFFLMIIAITVFALITDSSAEIIHGRVTTHRGEPLPGANVIVAGTDLGVITDINGEFEIRDVPPGDYELIIRFIGFHETVRPVHVEPDQPAEVFVELEEMAGEDSPVSVPIPPEDIETNSRDDDIPREAAEDEEPPIPIETEVPEQPTEEPRKEGKIAFNVPDTLQLNETVVIHLVLSAGRKLDEMKERITEDGDIRDRRVRISNVMTAELSGRGFEVEPITRAQQVVDPNDFTEWRWEVTALRPGKRQLHLTLSTVMEVNGTEKPKVLHSHSEDIEIYVTFQQRISGFVAQNWKWLWSAILVPFAGWLWENRKKRKLAASR